MLLIELVDLDHVQTLQTIETIDYRKIVGNSSVHTGCISFRIQQSVLNFNAFKKPPIQPKYHSGLGPIRFV